MSDSPLSKKFGAVVRKRRLDAGLSQEALAELAQIHPTYMSMVERGSRNLTLGVAARLAGALNVSLPELIEEAEEHWNQ